MQPKAVAAALTAAFLLVLSAHARDNGQWENSDPAVREWYRTLMQPDNPTVSCCGEADAYWADEFEVDKATGQFIAIITDTREDAPLGRPHIEPGTRILVPNEKIKFSQGNPTGHSVIFLSPSGRVYCFVTGTLS